MAADTDPDAPAGADLEDRIGGALAALELPDVDAAVGAGPIQRVRVDGVAAVVEADLGRLGGGAAEAVLAAVRGVEGIEGAHLRPAAAGADARVTADGVEPVIAVASAKGGVGKTTVATGLACALAADGRVALFDADVYGPNVPSLLGVEGPVRADAEGRPVPVPAGPVEVMSVDLLTTGGPLAWRGAMAHEAISDLLGTTAWRDPDAMVIDLPPGTGDVVLTTLESIRVDGVVVVTTPFHTSVADTRRSLELFRENGVPVLGVVVNMDHLACECGRTHDLFLGDATADLDARVLARLPFDPALQAGPRPGDVPAALSSLADAVGSRLGTAEATAVPDDAVDVRGLDPEQRVARLRSAFRALAPDEELRMVSDRDPSAAGDYLVDLCDADGPPEAVLPGFRVERRGPGTWLLTAGRP